MIATKRPTIPPENIRETAESTDAENATQDTGKEARVTCYFFSYISNKKSIFFIIIIPLQRDKSEEIRNILQDKIAEIQGITRNNKQDNENHDKENQHSISVSVLRFDECI